MQCVQVSYLASLLCQKSHAYVVVARRPLWWLNKEIFLQNIKQIIFAFTYSILAPTYVVCDANIKMYCTEKNGVRITLKQFSFTTCLYISPILTKKWLIKH